MIDRGAKMSLILVLPAKSRIKITTFSRSCAKFSQFIFYCDVRTFFVCKAVANLVNWTLFCILLI